VICLSGNTETVTPTYGVKMMKIPTPTFRPRGRQHMELMLVWENFQQLEGYEINHIDRLLGLW